MQLLTHGALRPWGGHAQRQAQLEVLFLRQDQIIQEEEEKVMQHQEGQAHCPPPLQAESAQPQKR